MFGSHLYLCEINIEMELHKKAFETICFKGFFDFFKESYLRPNFFFTKAVISFELGD